MLCPLQLLLQPSHPVHHLRPHHVGTCGLGATAGGGPSQPQVPAPAGSHPSPASTATSSQPRSLHLGDGQPGSQGHLGGSGPPGLDAALATCCWARPQVKRAHPSVVRAVTQDPGWALCGSLSSTVTTAAGGILGCSSLTYSHAQVWGDSGQVDGVQEPRSEVGWAGLASQLGPQPPGP